LEQDACIKSRPKDAEMRLIKAVVYQMNKDGRFEGRDYKDIKDVYIECIEELEMVDPNCGMCRRLHHCVKQFNRYSCVMKALLSLDEAKQ
jgi:hypothetical protein